MVVITTTITTVAAATSTATTATVMMALLLLLVLVLRRYAEPVPVVQQVRAQFDVRFHLLVVLAGQVRADRGFPVSGGGATDAVDAHHLICTCCSAAADAIQSIRFTSLFVVFHVG